VQNILHYIDEGIHVIDKDGITIMYNEAMEQIEGLERDMVIDKQLLEIFPSLDENTSTLLTVMKTGKPIINRTQTYLNYKGQKITTVNSTMPIFNDGMMIGALEIAKNITRIKELSEQLIDLQQEIIGKATVGKEIFIPKYNFNSIVGNSKELKEAIDIARKASKSDSSVLIYGETGTGKELFAQSIHYEGNRQNKPFIAQNCAALPEALLEGILFGTVKGGFTGAVDRPGLFEQANGGTLLLDEINSMGLGLQAKLLRVLQEGYIRRVGGIKDTPINVRIIATTNEDPHESIDKGILRKDLFYRINVISLRVPSLKERKIDINLLSEYFIKKYNDKLNKDVWAISRDMIELFQNYFWPGNVRELENMIEGAMNYISESKHVLEKEYFPSYLSEVKNREHNIIDKIDLKKSLPEIVEDIEKNMIEEALKESNFNVTKASQRLNIKRQTLQHKIKKYSIEI